MPTATTYIKPYKIATDKSAVQTMQERFEYALNPEKLGAVSSYLCDHTTAHSEFLLVHSQYKAETGRETERGALFFQIRQAFKPGEITPEEANRIGYETAMRWTKGKYQFFVCTHIDKGHIHNHIYYNSTAYDRPKLQVRRSCFTSRQIVPRWRKVKGQHPIKVLPFHVPHPLLI